MAKQRPGPSNSEIIMSELKTFGSDGALVSELIASCKVFSAFLSTTMDQSTVQTVLSSLRINGQVTSRPDYDYMRDHKTPPYRYWPVIPVGGGWGFLQKTARRGDGPRGNDQRSVESSGYHRLSL